MRVFVTGASGFVGSAVVRELIGAGHQVVGLARSDQGAASVSAAGAEVYRGDLTDLDGLRTAAAAADGVIHTAFIHDFSNFAASVEVDRRAIEAIGDALTNSDRPFVVTSGTALVRGSGDLATEDSAPDPAIPTSGRLANEASALSYVERGVRVSILRLPPTVHDEGDHGFVPGLIDIARAQGVSAYPGDGSNRWAAVHRLDAAVLYRLALESAPAGSRLHAVGEEGIPFRDIAEVIGLHLNLPLTTAEDSHFGWLAGFAVLDAAASSARTQELLDWHPTHPGLIADLEKGHYFTT
ncbi:MULTISPECIES: SDR family oxidoreductase [unclassified Kribbella]|uniref:SDR family oxidoreductase n=1 Tax=unclassified Kribbella TaxID=2644121 RepID=UPI003015D79F